MLAGVVVFFLSFPSNVVVFGVNLNSIRYFHSRKIIRSLIKLILKNCNLRFVISDVKESLYMFSSPEIEMIHVVTFHHPRRQKANVSLYTISV